MDKNVLKRYMDEEEITKEETIKIVINRCYGGFGLSGRAEILYNDRKGVKLDYFHNIERNCPVLVGLVEELGKDACGGYADLGIVEIPSDVEWTIEEYDGIEWIAEKHRTWA